MRTIRQLIGLIGILFLCLGVYAVVLEGFSLMNTGNVAGIPVDRLLMTIKLDGFIPEGATDIADPTAVFFFLPIGILFTYFGFKETAPKPKFRSR